MEVDIECTQAVGKYDLICKHWDNFIRDCGNTVNLNADLIFIPIQTDDHIACVCINFKDSTVDILDNQSHPDTTNSEIFTAASHLVCLSLFEIVNYIFPWTLYEH